MWQNAIQRLIEKICDFGLSADRRLDLRRVAYIRARDAISGLRDEIALRDCPLTVGERVCVQEGDKKFEGLIEYVVGVASRDELLGPRSGVTSGWSAGGHRYKSTNGELSSKWTFAVVSFDHTLQSGVWVANERGLEALFGLPPLP